MDKMVNFKEGLLFIKLGWHRHIKVTADIPNFSESFGHISPGY
jgi:hypothetical protein